MKDPEQFGGTESNIENLDDMIVQTGNDPAQLNLLLKFFVEMYEIAKPYADSKTGKINAPNKKIPIDKLSSGLKSKIDTIDSAFIETIRYTEWLQVFKNGQDRIRQKILQKKFNIHNELR
jgi:hypothetical protein